MKKIAECSFETTVSDYPTTRCNNPQNVPQYAKRFATNKTVQRCYFMWVQRQASRRTSALYCCLYRLIPKRPDVWLLYESHNTEGGGWLNDPAEKETLTCLCLCVCVCVYLCVCVCVCVCVFTCMCLNTP
jgi:hypothetical protein